MRAVVQRVESASVEVGGHIVGSCARGYLILLGVGAHDDEGAARLLWDKVRHLRIFDDEDGKANRSLLDVGADLLVVSQFTLYADCRRGRRPSFTEAAEPKAARTLYELFCELAHRDVEHVGRGVFGADMRVSLVNDGPFTVWLDTDELAPGRRRTRT